MTANGVLRGCAGKGRKLTFIQLRVDIVTGAGLQYGWLMTIGRAPRRDGGVRWWGTLTVDGIGKLPEESGKNEASLDGNDQDKVGLMITVILIDLMVEHSGNVDVIIDSAEYEGNDGKYN